MRLLLCAFLLLWEPINLASEALSVLPAIHVRGTRAAVELAAHTAVAALTAAAGVSLWNLSPDAARLARIAVAASGIRTVHSLWWTVLPRDVSPGAAVPLTAFALAHAGFWLVYLRRYHQHQLSDHRA